MEHSMRAYLERQSTQALKKFLQNCVSINGWQQYAHAVPMIVEILQQRKESSETDS